MNKIDKQIEYHYQKATDIALKEVERLAREILKEHPEFKEFIMAMGSYFFTTKKKGEIISTWENVYKGNRYVKENAKDCFVELNDFIRKWDDLKLTGCGMRFTATGKVVTDW